MSSPKSDTDRIALLEEELKIERTIRIAQESIINATKGAGIVDTFIDQSRQLIEISAYIAYFINSQFQFVIQHQEDATKDDVKQAEKLLEDGSFVWALNRRKASFIPSERKKTAVVLVPLIGREPLGMIILKVPKSEQNSAPRIMNTLTFIARIAALSTENRRLEEAEKTSEKLHQVNQELVKANEVVGKLIIEKDRVFKQLELSQLELAKKARDLEQNNSEQLRINEKLKETQLKLEEYGKTLEQKVQERTQEIEAANTQLIEATQTLQQTNVKLQEADQLKNDFLSFTAHELRTPITSIKAFAEILLSEPKADEKKEEFLGIIKSESDRLTRLINDLLDIIKIESGQMDWDLKPAHLPDIIIHGISLTKAIANDASITVNTHIEENLPPVLCDKDRIVQVLTNLIGNAIKFTPDGGTITIRCRAVNQSHESIADHVPEDSETRLYAMTSVQDTGPGISLQDMEKVFQKFKQIKGQKGRHHGTGLGLPISREILRHHEGNLWVNSKLGKGSMFSFILPCGDPPATTL